MWMEKINRRGDTMKGWRRATRVIGMLAALSSSMAVSSNAAACDAANRSQLPKCATWEVDYVLGIRIRNQCRFAVNYVIVQRVTGGKDILGRADPDETVAVTGIARAEIRAIYCCRDRGRC
jgi:hypothetical protein